MTRSLRNVEIFLSMFRNDQTRLPAQFCFVLVDNEFADLSQKCVSYMFEMIFRFEIYFFKLVIQNLKLETKCVNNYDEQNTFLTILKSYISLFQIFIQNSLKFLKIRKKSLS